MPVVIVLFWILVIGLIVWAVNTWVPLPAPYMKLFNIVAIVATVIWLLLWLASMLGIAPFPSFPLFHR
jgi:hypothetical protein